jgi:hypothetical protein
MSRPAVDPAVRFWPRVNRGPDCWEWTGARLKNGGYGVFWDGRRNVKAHRWAYEHLVGPIPPALTIDHLCRNTACVRPDHLEPVTNRVNILRGTAPSAQSARKTHCVNGHPFTHHNGSQRRCRTCLRATHRRYRERQKARQS